MKNDLELIENEFNKLTKEFNKKYVKGLTNLFKNKEELAPLIGLKPAYDKASDRIKFKINCHYKMLNAPTTGTYTEAEKIKDVKKICSLYEKLQKEAQNGIDAYNQFFNEQKEKNTNK